MRKRRFECAAGRGEWVGGWAYLRGREGDGGLLLGLLGLVVGRRDLRLSVRRLLLLRLGVLLLGWVGGRLLLLVLGLLLGWVASSSSILLRRLLGGVPICLLLLGLAIPLLLGVAAVAPLLLLLVVRVHGCVALLCGWGGVGGWVVFLVGWVGGMEGTLPPCHGQGAVGACGVGGCLPSSAGGPRASPR